MKYFPAAFLILAFFTIPFSANGQIIKTPTQAAQGFYKAWNAKNRKSAQNFARAEPVEKLFGVRRQQMTFKGCTKREAGDGGGGYECLYENTKIDLTMAMIVKIFRAGYKVTEVSFSSEAY